jgi:CRP-like cAMP-binding protein
MSAHVALTDEEFARLTEMIEIRSFDKREHLLKAGEVENYLNFLVKGLARVYFYKGRAEIITHIARENEIISSSASFLSGAPSNYFVEALEPSTFLSISRIRLEKLYLESSRMERLGRLMTTHFFLLKEEWEHECIRLDAGERFLRFVQGNPDLMQRAPQKYLASYLNMKPETFSRLKHLLGKKGIAEVGGTGISEAGGKGIQKSPE